MTWAEVVLAIGVVLALLLWVIWVDASRLDRLHRRVDASRTVLDTQLVHRATAAAELATSGALDPASAIVVGEAAWAALSAGGDDTPPGAVARELRAVLEPPARQVRSSGPDLDRGQLESDLTAALREVLDEPEEVEDIARSAAGSGLLADLAAAWYRVQLSRRFHNNAVTQARQARRGVMVRLLRLAGSAPEPQTFEIDDDWPRGLPQVPARD
jgi:hypothetical protein